MTNNKKILVTGAAGFIGSALTKLLFLKNGKNVVGIDSLNSYYSTKLKNDRIKNINFSKYTKGNWSFIKADIKDKYELEEILKKYSLK